MTRNFEVYQKQRHARDLPPTIRVTDKLIAFRAAAMPLIAGATHLQLLFDADTRRAALRPASADAESAYKITRHPSGSQAWVYASLFIAVYGIRRGSYSIEVADELLIIGEPA